MKREGKKWSLLLSEWKCCVSNIQLKTLSHTQKLKKYAHLYFFAIKRHMDTNEFLAAENKTL